MPLPKPALDNRRFDQLVSETRGLLSRASPQWTDHNASDPGITLLELGAWLAEQNIYRFDRLSDEARRAFVRLLGFEPLAAGVARTVVALHSTAPIQLPPRIQLSSDQGPLFESTAAQYVSPARLQRIAVDSVQPADESARNEARSPFHPFGLRPRLGHALLLGFDRALDAAAATLSLHAWTDHWPQDAATRAALIDAQRNGCPPWQQHYRVRTAWEYRSSAGWQPLSNVVDETRALTLTGFVRFDAPVDHTRHPADGLFYLRCRIARGRHECPPQLAHIAFNALSCEHALSRAARHLGASRGHAGAVFAIGEAPVVAGSIQLRLDDGAGATQDDWREAADWDRAGAHDRVFRLDAERGELHSGDGLRGEIIPAGFSLLAAYRHGGGSEGNVAAGTLIDVPPNMQNLTLAPLLGLGARITVVQPFAAEGGAPREPIAQTQARAFEAASRVDKAVTLTDIERITLDTPGVPVARAAALADLDPLLPCVAAPGTVTVVVIPLCRRPGPMPSQALLDAVARHLEPRRLVASQIHVAPPRYRRISVEATLHLACGADAQHAERAARARIDAFLDPLSGGPDGTGWPFGRPVYRSEVMALLAGTVGIDRVTQLGLRAGADGPTCDNVELCPHELVRPGRHRLHIETQIARNLKRSEPHECEPR